VLGHQLLHRGKRFSAGSDGEIQLVKDLCNGASRLLVRTEEECLITHITVNRRYTRKAHQVTVVIPGKRIGPCQNGPLGIANSRSRGAYNAGDANPTLAEGGLDGVADGVDSCLLAGIWSAEFPFFL